MTDTNESAMLHQAWEKRKPIWNEGTKLIEEGNALWKEVAGLPGSARVSIWLSISDMSCEAAQKIHQGYNLRNEADQIWHDAIIELKGPKAKVAWAFDSTRKGYICTLESGEVFEP